MVRKIRRVKRTLRLPCDHLPYIDEDGEEFYPRVGQWIEIRKKTSGQDYAAMIALSELAGEEGETVTVADAVKMIKSMPEMYGFLAHKIITWNWTDLWSDNDVGDDGELPLLPPPTIEVIETLDFDTDLIHLVELIVETEETPKNESRPS